jgi:hypothetical protein
MLASGSRAGAVQNGRPGGPRSKAAIAAQEHPPPYAEIPIEAAEAGVAVLRAAAQARQHAAEVVELGAATQASEAALAAQGPPQPIEAAEAGVAVLRAAAQARQHAVSARRSLLPASASPRRARTTGEHPLPGARRSRPTADRASANKRARVAAHSVEQHRRLALTTSGPDAAVWDQRFRDIRLEAERVRGVSHPWA